MTSKIRTVSVFVIVDPVAVFNTTFVCMCLSHLQTKFHMTNANGLLVIEALPCLEKLKKTTKSSVTVGGISPRFESNTSIQPCRYANQLGEFG
jgi:hypothetical protein